MCGEKNTLQEHRLSKGGSPPRVRGKVYTGPLPTGSIGITPACAGKRPTTPDAELPVQDHPRVCGEKLYMTLLSRTALGSPPRVRGKGMMISRHFMTVRITPACAGKRLYTYTLTLPYWDHPRVCGEKKKRSELIAQNVGSPPRVRGKGSYQLPIRSSARITPACAGKSIPKAQNRHTAQDHPRVCGEKSFCRV